MPVPAAQRTARCRAYLIVLPDGSGIEFPSGRIIWFTITNYYSRGYLGQLNGGDDMYVAGSSGRTVHFALLQLQNWLPYSHRQQREKSQIQGSSWLVRSARSVKLYWCNLHNWSKNSHYLQQNNDCFVSVCTQKPRWTAIGPITCKCVACARKPTSIATSVYRTASKFK